MARIQLTMYIDPGGVEVLMNVKRVDDGYERITAFVDTGAEVSLLPRYLLNELEHRLSTQATIDVEQAVIAQQGFTATEAFVRLFLEDGYGNQTKEIEARVWFTDTKIALLGFDGILDEATLHIDMRQARGGWIELDD